MIFPEHYRLVPESEVLTRLDKTRAVLAGKCSAALISWPADLFYLTGSNQAGYLLLAPEAEPLFLVRRSAERAEAESPVAVRPLESLSRLAGQIEAHLGGRPDRLGLALDVLPYREAVRLAQLTGAERLVDIGPTLLDLRQFKSAWELEMMARAGELHAGLMAQVPEMFKPGMTEAALAGEITARFMATGGQGFLRSRKISGEIYPWHLVAGDRGLLTSRVEAPFGGLGSSPSFPQGASMEPIGPGQMILIDYGICWDGYLVDVTRMFCHGPAPQAGLAAYQALVDIEAWLLERMKPGARGDELYQGAVDLAEKLGFGREFLGEGPAAISFVGHGVGLEFGEPPYLAAGRPDLLAEGQTLALELKMVLPGLGAVGLENTVAVTADGARKLTRADERFIIID